jgi:hypothetical protein
MGSIGELSFHKPPGQSAIAWKETKEKRERWGSNPAPGETGKKEKLVGRRESNSDPRHFAKDRKFSELK